MADNQPTGARDEDANGRTPQSQHDESYRRAVVEAAERGAEWSKELLKRLR
ncbi:hypothetical protein [Gordonia sp. DT101]|uniref:hypothetical protein n=1 Tax=Gordonia sp. DT101 TaxID=3416545 RepID=UPI003CF5CD7C